MNILEKKYYFTLIVTLWLAFSCFAGSNLPSLELNFVSNSSALNLASMNPVRTVVIRNKVFLLFRYTPNKGQYERFVYSTGKTATKLQLSEDKLKKEDALYIERLRAYLQNYIENFLFENERLPDEKEMRQRLDKVTGRATVKGVVKKKSVSMKQFLEYFTSEHKRKARTGEKGWKRYRRLYGTLFRPPVVRGKQRYPIGYSHFLGTEIDFDIINTDFIEKFVDDYLFEMCGYSNDYARTILIALKTVLKEASAKGISENLLYLSGDFVILREQGSDDVFCDFSELQQMYNTKFDNQEALERDRDLFLIGSFCGGQRYTDATRINKDSFIEDQDLFKIISVKTNEYVYIPIHPIVREIMEKWNWNLPQTISSQKMNENLKKITKKAGLTGIETLLKSKGGKLERIKAPKYEWITTKTMRKTFASNCWIAGWDKDTIKAITGHTTDSAFFKYVTKAAKIKKALSVTQRGLYDKWTV